VCDANIDATSAADVLYPPPGVVSLKDCECLQLEFLANALAVWVLQAPGIRQRISGATTGSTGGHVVLQCRRKVQLSD
jgi:hypothetical protein